MSSPRAATSVAMRTRNLPLRKAAIVFSRTACGMSPCRHFASSLSASELVRSSHSALVWQKTITRPEEVVYIEMTSLIVEDRALIGPGEGMARWRTSDEAFFSLSPTKSTTRGEGRMYFGASLTTHGGNVAEKRHVCRSSRVQVARISAMSSAKPMSSIWSASSRVAQSTSHSSSAERPIKSLTRPGVPISTSTPRRSSEHCAPIGAPPYTQQQVRVGATAANSRPTCCASSRVGASTSASGRHGFGSERSTFLRPSSRSIVGSAKASVLPQPV
mmetsp:Transcript_49766/g.160244  ORF Transcript_49766/g.160244 Transcript_49766/m.160244 type:complete len:274 (-) Transcript_49766:420-1241(-)